MDRVTFVIRAGTAVDSGGRKSQEAGLGPGFPGSAWSLSKVWAHQAAAPGREGQLGREGVCFWAGRMDRLCPKGTAVFPPRLGPECLCAHCPSPLLFTHPFPPVPWRTGPTPGVEGRCVGQPGVRPRERSQLPPGRASLLGQPLRHSEPACPQPPPPVPWAVLSLGSAGGWSRGCCCLLSHWCFPSLCRRCSGPMELSGSPPPSAPAVSFSLGSASRKPKGRLWSKSQPILRGDDSPSQEFGLRGDRACL